MLRESGRPCRSATLRPRTGRSGGPPRRRAARAPGAGRLAWGAGGAGRASCPELALRFRELAARFEQVAQEADKTWHERSAEDKAGTAVGVVVDHTRFTRDLAKMWPSRASKVSTIRRPPMTRSRPRA